MTGHARAAARADDASAPEAGERADQRAFGGVARLFGEAGLSRLRAAHVVVVGLGGVGSWAVEALARSGVGALTLIDLDHVAESNLNRQIQALRSTLGAHKGAALAARIADIAPDCRVQIVDDFVTVQNAASIVPDQADAVIDAIDQVAPKAALIALCAARRQSVIVCGGAGGRTDALSLVCTDLARAHGDALLASVRGRLRRMHGFARAPQKSGETSRIIAFGIDAVHCTEQAAAAVSDQAGVPLACAGYGSLVTVTAAIGMAAAGRVIGAIANGR